MSTRARPTYLTALAICGWVLIAGGCGKLSKPDVEEAPVVEEPAAPPPQDVIVDLPPPTPEQVVSGFLELPPIQKNDNNLAKVAEQTEQVAGIEELVLAGSIVSNLGAESLPKFTGLKRLHLSGSRVSGKALEYVAQLPALEVLGINGVGLEDADLKPLQNMQTLRELSLAGTSIGDGAFETLAALEHLEVLDVSANDQVLGRTFTELVKQHRFGALRSLKADGSGFGQFGLLELGSLPHLEYFSVASSFASDDGLAGLRSSRSLRTLHLNNNRLTSAGLVHLKRLTQLEELWLGGNAAIADDGLTHLRGLKQLKELSIGGTRCSEAGVRQLKDRFLKSTLIKVGPQEF